MLMGPRDLFIISTSFVKWLATAEVDEQKGKNTNILVKACLIG
jgi:hypothetical protein